MHLRTLASICLIAISVALVGCGRPSEPTIASDPDEMAKYNNPSNVEEMAAQAAKDARKK